MSEIDETIERLCEVYCQYRFASPSGFVRYVDQSPSDKVAIRAGIRAVYEAVLADLRPMPDRLEVANALRKVRGIPINNTRNSWDDLHCSIKGEVEAMLELFAGRTQSEKDSEIEKLERVNEQLQESRQADRELLEGYVGRVDRLTAERDALAAEIEAANSKLLELDVMVAGHSDALATAEGERDRVRAKLHAQRIIPTEEEVIQIAEQCSWDIFEQPLYICSQKDMLKRVVRFTLTIAPRLPYQPPEGVTNETLWGVVSKTKMVDSDGCPYSSTEVVDMILDHLGITLPAAPMSLDEMREILAEANRWCESEDESDNNVGMAIECLTPCVSALEAAINQLENAS